VFTPPAIDHPIVRLANTSQGIRLPSRAKSPPDRASWAQARVATNSGLARTGKLLKNLSPFMKDHKLYELENKNFQRFKVVEGTNT
jgi:hypothetical protein